MGRIFLLFLRRLWLPLVVFAGFSLMCVLVYRHLEGLRWQDALFWMIQPHAIDYQKVHNATKFFSMFVFVGVFAFQIWVAERVLITIFNRQGAEAWRTMVNDVNIAKLSDHFIICGYGQVGRTVVDQLTRLKIPLVLIETNPDLCRELLKDKILVIQRRFQAPRYSASGRNRARPRRLHRDRQRRRQSLHHRHSQSVESESANHHPRRPGALRPSHAKFRSRRSHHSRIRRRPNDGTHDREVLPRNPRKLAMTGKMVVVATNAVTTGSVATNTIAIDATVFESRRFI
jgi:hypothetical protein